MPISRDSKKILQFRRDIIALLRMVPKDVIKLSPDIIIAHNVSTIPIAHKIAKVCKSKIVLYVHNYDYVPSIRAYLRMLYDRHANAMLQGSKHYIQYVDLVVTTSEVGRRVVRQLLEVDSCIVRPGCIPIKEFRVERSDYVLSVARLSPGKAHHVVAYAVSKINPQIPVIFAGAYHHRTKELSKLIERCTLKSYRLVVDPSEDELRELYARAKIFVSVNEEWFGMPIIEAAAMGVPLIASKRSGAAEIFDHNIHGYFIEFTGEPEYDESLLSEVIKDVLENYDEALKKALKAWELVSTKYTWHHSVKQLLLCVQKLL